MRSKVNKNYDYEYSDVVCERLKQFASIMLYILAFAFAFFCEPLATFLGI